MVLRSGETFAGYLIERELGRGGMGAVYLAQHPRLPRLTALKLLNRDLFGDNETRMRFEREADLVSRLDHPHIVPIYDRGVEGDRLWISMRYVNGVDATALDSAKLAPAQAIRIIADTAKALDFAHRKGILHRDVKPANILLETDEGEQRVFLADFGIARLRDDATKLTQAGSFTATLAYAAPEQLTGGELDHRCDQYSLACTLFKLLTGSVPFTAEHPVAIMQGHLNQPPPRPSELRPGLPPALDAVMARAMAKSPAARFDSCTEFATAAQQALTGGYQPRPAGAPITPPPNGRYAPPRGATSSPAMPLVAPMAAAAPAAAFAGKPPTKQHPHSGMTSAPGYSPTAPGYGTSTPRTPVIGNGGPASVPRGRPGPGWGKPPKQAKRRKKSRTRGCLLWLAGITLLALLAIGGCVAIVDQVLPSKTPSTTKMEPPPAQEETYEPTPTWEEPEPTTTPAPEGYTAPIG